VSHPRVYEYLLEHYPEIVPLFEQYSNDIRAFEKELTKITETLQQNYKRDLTSSEINFFHFSSYNDFMKKIMIVGVPGRTATLLQRNSRKPQTF